MPRLLIYHTNDLHDHLDEETMRRLLPRDAPHLLFDSGDAIRGSNTYFRLEEPVLEKMNRLGYHAMAMGNREFHYFRWVLRRRAARLRFPLLAANLEDLAGGTAGAFRPHVRIDHAGMTVGLFGLTVPQYPEEARVELLSRFRFLDEVRAARSAVSALRREGVDVVILLSHLGVQRDEDLAREVAGIDLILGGHSHTVIPRPFRVGSTWLAQTGAHGKFLGRIELEIGTGNERMINAAGSLVPIKPEFIYEAEIANRKKTVLFVSNGYGEDAIAATVLSELRAAAEVNVVGFPLVGDGRAYRAFGVPVAAPCRAMPSGGISGWTNPGNFLHDMRRGLLALTATQAARLRGLRWKVDLVVAVGDLFSAGMALLFTRRPVVFIGTAKSAYVSGYSRVERLLMRRCARVFPRDDPTTRDLLEGGVPATFVGNAMMDGLTPGGLVLPALPGEVVVAVLPGSRQSAYADFSLMVRSMEALARASPSRQFRFLVAVPRSIELAGLTSALAGPRWARLPDVPAPASPEGGGGEFRGVVAGYRHGEGITVVFIKGYFPDILLASRVVIGQAGTGNEQAAGLGKPVVAFDPNAGGRLGWYRRRQKQLLGDAVAVVPSDPLAIAAEVSAILDDPERERRMGESGRSRMGPPGAAERMAAALKEILEQHGTDTRR